jgi:hypothetical protein
MDVERIAEALVARAREHGHAVVRTDGTTPVAALRSAVRNEAHRRGTRIRTGMVEDVLAVVTSDAPLWDEDGPAMRRALAAPVQVGVVR